MSRRYTEAALDAALDALGVLKTSAPAPPMTAKVISLPGIRSPVFDGCTSLPDMNAAAHAGLPDRHWFGCLTTGEQNELLRQIFALPNVVAAAHGNRNEWLRLLFGAAHAGLLGATAARATAEAWSRSSDKFNQGDFDKSWASFDGARA